VRVSVSLSVDTDDERFFSRSFSAKSQYHKLGVVYVGKLLTSTEVSQFTKPVIVDSHKTHAHANRTAFPSLVHLASYIYKQILMMMMA